MKLKLYMLILVLGLFISAQPDRKEKTTQDGQKLAELNICFVSASDNRKKDFEEFFTENKIKFKSLSFDELSNDAVKDFDLVMLDPANGKVNKYGQTDSRDTKIPENLKKPVIAIGAAGSYALIPSKLKFGNNG